MTRVGVIGIGKWGVNHLRSLREIQCDLIGVSDVDTKKKEIADQYNVKFFRDYTKLFDEVDAVTVATSTDTHYQIVKECLHAGKHVLVEKPVAETSEQGKKLVDLARSKGLVLSVGYLFRFNNSVRKTKEILKDVGDIEYISCRYIHSTKPPRKDSGVIMNLGIHVFDILNFMTGQIPVTVCAQKKNLLSPVFEDSASILLGYKDFFATVELSCMHPEKARDFWVVGENETVYVDYFEQKILRHPLKVTYEFVKRTDAFAEKVVVNEPLKDELQYFVDLVSTKNIDLEENLGKENYYTTRLGELCLQSADNGKELKVR